MLRLAPLRSVRHPDESAGRAIYGLKCPPAVIAACADAMASRAPRLNPPPPGHTRVAAENAVTRCAAAAATTDDKIECLADGLTTLSNRVQVCAGVCREMRVLAPRRYENLSASP